MFQMMALLYAFQVIVLFNLIILAMLKMGGGCFYYKENLSLRSIDVPFLSQCVFCEVTLQS